MMKAPGGVIRKQPGEAGHNHRDKPEYRGDSGAISGEGKGKNQGSSGSRCKWLMCWPV